MYYGLRSMIQDTFSKLALKLPGLDPNGPQITINEPTKYSNLGQVSTAALDMLLYISAFLFFIWSLWGVFRYLTAEGEKEQLKKSRDQIRWALIGFLVVVIAIMISRYVQSVILPNPINLTPITYNLVTPAFAQEGCTCSKGQLKAGIGSQRDIITCRDTAGNQVDQPVCKEGVEFDSVTGESRIKNPTVNLKDVYAFGGLQSLGALFSRFTPTVVAIFATMVSFYIIIAAVKFIVSEGDKASISEAKKTITHTLLALVFFVLLFLIVRFILPFFGIGINIF